MSVEKQNYFLLELLFWYGFLLICNVQFVFQHQIRFLYFYIGNECRNNATCHDIHLGYWCECTLPGYEGILCERERDECSDWEPCQNGGTCVDMFNGYR